MKQRKQGISVTLDEDVVIAIRELAYNSGRSVSQCIDLILKRYIEQRQKAEKKEIVD